METMKINILLMMSMMFIFQTAWSFSWFGERYCKQPEFKCITIKRGDSWGQLFTNPLERDLVRRLNRLNVFLQPDMVIAVPNDFSKLTLNSMSPLAPSIDAIGEKTIQVDLSQLAWGAYDEQGHLINWGPLSSGSEKCLESPDGCATPTGFFRVIRKEGANCVSKTFPRAINGVNGGAEMPFCIFFYRGYALHGSSEVPGYQASYGCLRLFTDDAKWLNEVFVDLPKKGKKGTPVIISKGRVHV